MFEGFVSAVQEFIDSNSPYLPMGQIYKILERSDQSYEVKSYTDEPGLKIDDFLGLYFPEYRNHIEHPKVIEDTEKPGAVRLTEFHFDPKAQAASDEGEKHFIQSNCDEALKHYQNAISISEDFYPAYLNAGDCYLKNDPEEALKYYNKAKEINPYDYRVHFFSASAYMNMLRYEDARKSYIRALTLRPRYGMIMVAIASAKDALKVDLHIERFTPKALAVKKGKTIVIYISEEDQGVWTAYAFAKALWIGEPEYRKRYLKTEESNWTSMEEVQSIFTMIDLYQGMLDDQKIQEIQYFERLKKIIEDGDLWAFIMYEIGPNLGADIVLLLPESQRQQIQEYVEKYVVVSR